jgi:glycosyltransferase involved in cell wall biosynthesis
VVLRHVVNRGQGASLQTGIDFALQQGAEYIVTFDADGQHPVDAISRLLEPILAGKAAVALGSRFLEDADAVPWPRRILLSAAVLFTRVTSGARLGDAHNGLRALSREAARTIEIRLDRMAHASDLVEQVHRSGLPYTEVPVRISYTPYSRAKGQRWSSTFGVAFDYLVGKLLR